MLASTTCTQKVLEYSPRLEAREDLESDGSTTSIFASKQGIKILKLLEVEERPWRNSPSVAAGFIWLRM